MIQAVLEIVVGVCEILSGSGGYFVFLAQEGIAQNLATYYEEYSTLLIEKQNISQA